MSLTERERELVACVRWLATVFHEAYHRHEGEESPYTTCSRSACQYAASITGAAMTMEDG